MKSGHLQVLFIALFLLSLVSAGSSCWIQPDKNGHVVIPNSVTSIGYNAFDGCTSLRSIDISNTVTSIGYSAFYGCTSLFSIAIPNSVTSIDKFAFWRCTSLSSITIPNGVTFIGDDPFPSCYGYGLAVPGMVNPTGVVTCAPCANRNSIDLWQNITSIGDSAFARCTSLSSVTIPNRVTSIGDQTFYGCTSLSSVTIPNSVTSIANHAFVYCTSLSSVTIGNSVTSIGFEAFYACTSLSSITIPNSVTSIGDSAFDSCPCNGDYEADVHLCDCVSIPMNATCKYNTTLPTTISTTTSTPQHATPNSLSSLGIGLTVTAGLAVVSVCCVVLAVLWRRRQPPLSQPYTTLSLKSSTHATYDHDEHTQASAPDVNNQHVVHVPPQPPRYEYFSHV